MTTDYNKLKEELASLVMPRPDTKKRIVWLKCKGKLICWFYFSKNRIQASWPFEVDEIIIT